MSNQPSHFMPSQKGTYVNMDSNESPLAPSQKGVNIEKGPQPRTQDKGKDANLPPQPKMFQRRKKPSQDGSQGAHTVVQSFTPSLTEPILTSAIDASPTNVEKQPRPIHYLFLLQLHNLKFLQEIAMIDNQTFSNSPSLQLREEPKLQTVIFSK